MTRRNLLKLSVGAAAAVSLPISILKAPKPNWTLQAHIHPAFKLDTGERFGASFSVSWVDPNGDAKMMNYAYLGDDGKLTREQLWTMRQQHGNTFPVLIDKDIAHSMYIEAARNLGVYEG